MNAARALLYLYGMTLWGSLRERVRRLRQPKYLVGAIAGGAYIYYFMLRNYGGRAGGWDGSDRESFIPLAALLLAGAIFLGWILPNRRAALQFSEAGIAFLFPAPVTRRTLIHAQLLRSQIAILFSSVFLTFVFRRTGAGAGVAGRAIGWWVILSTLNLHLLGASFLRERLTEHGLNPVRRRLLLGGGLAALVAGCWLVVRRTLPPPTDADAASLGAMLGYGRQILTTPPVSWVLAPFVVVVHPYLAATPADFLGALWPALLLIGVHYLWVARSDVAFEEASVELAARRAARIAAARSGRWHREDRPAKARREPFALAARGAAAVAFLWRGLLALGPAYRLRYYVLGCAVAVAGLGWLGADSAREPTLRIIGSIGAGLSVWAALFIPMLFRRDLQLALDQADIIKAYPLEGWQVVLGALLTPMTVLMFLEWFLLLVALGGLGGAVHHPLLVAATGATGAIAVALLVPPLCGLMLCIPFAGVLYFPAWARPGNVPGGGIELLGQRLIFLLGYVVVLVAAVLPAGAAGAAAWLIGNWLAGPFAAALAGAAAAGILLALELGAAVFWLGWRFERFDLSTELPR